MMQVRCQKCGWSFTLGRDAIANIVEEIQESRPAHYMIDCPKCRQGIKVQTRILKRYYHPQETPDSVEEGATQAQDT